jgi:hypothetical protein
MIKFSSLTHINSDGLITPDEEIKRDVAYIATIKALVNMEFVERLYTTYLVHGKEAFKEELKEIEEKLRRN